jgi:putative hydrolase of the HAD superfamily
VGTTYARFFAAQGAALPASRLDEAFGRVLRGMPAMLFPHARAEDVPRHERDWWREIVRRTLRSADGSARLTNFDACFAGLFAHYASPAAWEAAPGAAAALDHLAGRGLRLAVVSNFDHRLPGLLAALGLERRLACIVLPADAGAAKPDPRIFALALETLGVAASDAAYVGDDPADDHEGARRAGLRAVDMRQLATLAALPDLLARTESPG